MVKVVYPSILCDDTVRKLSAIGIEKMSDYVNEIESAPDAVKLLFKDKLEMIIDRLILSLGNQNFTANDVRIFKSAMLYRSCKVLN